MVTNPGYLLGPEDYDLRCSVASACATGEVACRWRRQEGSTWWTCVTWRMAICWRRKRSGRRRDILGGENQTFAAFMRALARAGFAPRVLPQLPYWVLAATAGCPSCGRGSPARNRIPPGHVRLNRFHWYYRSDRAATELGFHSRALTATIADTLRWFVERKPLKQRGLNRWWLHPQAA